MQAPFFFLSPCAGKAAVLPYLFSRGEHLFKDGFDFDLLIGVEMAVGRLLQMPDGSHSALVQGRRRVEIVEFIRTKKFSIRRGFG